MTETTTVIQQGNEGDHGYVIAEFDISSLDSAGAEPVDPRSKFNLDGAEAHVVDQEEPRRHFQYDPDNTEVRVKDRGPVQRQRSEDPASQEYGGSSETVLVTYDEGDAAGITPINFNPADPSDADLSIILRAEFHDGTTTDLATIADGTEQTRENLIDGLDTGDDGKVIRKLILVVDNSGTAVTEDIGASTVEYEAVMADAANNDDVGAVTMRFAGDFVP